MYGMAKLNDQPMSYRQVTTAVVLVLAFLLTWPCGFTVPFGDRPVSARVAGNCCGHHRAKCASPACCTRPAQPSAPLSAAPAASTSQNEWQLLAASVDPVLALLSRSADRFPLGVAWFPLLNTIPLFQRDCCYLL